jgi:hypothetical protein
MKIESQPTKGVQLTPSSRDVLQLSPLWSPSPFTFPLTGFEMPGPRKRFEGFSTGDEGSSKLEVPLANWLEVTPEPVLSIHTYDGNLASSRIRAWKHEGTHLDVEDKNEVKL